VIDEVLAVGDAEFQKKAIGKMQDISRGGGRTVLFVSHNMAAIKQLCTKTIVLEFGSVVFEGSTNDGIEYYLQSNQYEGYVGHYVNETVEESGFVSLALVDKNDEIRTEFGFDEPIANKIKVQVAEKLFANGYTPQVLTSSAVVGESESKRLFDAAYAEHARRLSSRLTGSNASLGGAG
jgi:lipopolysaccharide transport system ATP-binding protein